MTGFLPPHCLLLTSFSPPSACEDTQTNASPQSIHWVANLIYLGGSHGASLELGRSCYMVGLRYSPLSLLLSLPCNRCSWRCYSVQQAASYSTLPLPGINHLKHKSLEENCWHWGGEGSQSSSRWWTESEGILSPSRFLMIIHNPDME